ncbi:MAG: glycosyltransferase [Desulfovibrio sp.]|jgi:GT2 family glycosyltransferase|nr:glycosyltransferase [Desulfovibrio sp.]
MGKDAYAPTDRFEELDLVDLDGAFGILDAHCRNLVPDLESCLAFLSRILRDPAAAEHPAMRGWVVPLVRKARALGPFHLQCLDMAHRLFGDADAGRTLERLRAFPLDASLYDFTSVMNDPGKMERKRAKIMNVLARTPGHVLAASQLLQLDYYEGRERGGWRDAFVVPPFFRRDWEQRLFLHHAALGDAAAALELLPAVEALPPSEPLLNLMAELHARTGDTAKALLRYGQSLALDPRQAPVRHRMAELAHPTRPDMRLPDQADVCICLYSWNKADDLEKTLAGLARTQIGRARIRILLNGCTDRSAQVVEAARALFPNSDYGVVSLPVNVGAPAARNWLGSLPEVRASEFVAYIDDDVELPADWLAHFLGVLRAHTAATVVGAKVVFGTEPRMLQYLYRSFSLACDRGIKLTDPCQIAQFDTGLYDFVRPADTVMGCCHLLRMAHLPGGPQFDLRYSPSQVDDVAHDLALRVQGREVYYCGLVRCIHHQNTGGGFKRRLTSAQKGQVLGNDTKFFYCFQPHIERIREIVAEAARRDAAPAPPAAG